MSEKRLTISLSPAALAGGIVCLCAGFVLVFSLGVLLGRGHNLEERIPKLERILPERATPTPPQVIAEDAPSVPGGPERQSPAKPEEQTSATPAKDPGAKPGVAPPAVIPQGDLAFRDNLKTPAKPAQQAGTGASATAPAKQPPAASQATGQSAATTAGQTSPGDNQVYHYVYQAAAYKSEAPCAAFVNKLNKAGFRARTDRSESGGTVWYRAMIDFTGKPDDTDALRVSMQKYGVQRLLMRSKTPAQ